MKGLVSFIICLFVFSNCYPQSRQMVAKMINDKKLNHALFEEVNLFQPILDNEIDSLYSTAVNHATVFRLEPTTIAGLLNTRPECIQLNIAAAEGTIHIELIRSQIFTPDFSVVLASNPDNKIAIESGLHYWGIVKGNSASVCAVSIFGNEVMGIFSIPSKGNYNLGKMKDSPLYVFYNDRDLRGNLPFECKPNSTGRSYTANELIIPQTSATNCIRLYWEVDFDVYTFTGSVSQTTNYITGLFNQVAVLFWNDGIPIELSQVFVWDVHSPYNATDIIAQLDSFQFYRNSFNGDLAHLLGTGNGLGGTGGIAGSLNGLCPVDPDSSQCFSTILMSYQNIPVYSYTVYVVSHEQGHLMGSNHTHACVWNGNNTSIDSCHWTIGFCNSGGPPFPPNGGTIMSYCNQTSVGINFANGFGPQPAGVILNYYNNSTCLTPCLNSLCNQVTYLRDSTVTTTTAFLVWDSISGSTGYIIRYRESGTFPWNIDTILAPEYHLTGLIPGTGYEWHVQTICSTSPGPNSPNAIFLTAPTICHIPSNLNTTNITSFSAVFIWSNIQAAIGYVVQYRQTGSATWQTDTISINNFSVTGLSITTSYEWQVQALCAGGGVSLISTTIIFTTLGLGTSVTIVLQPDSLCGKDALIESNIHSRSDTLNFGDGEEFNALAVSNSDTTIQRSLLQFDLSFIPVSSHVSSATLSLFYNPNSGNSGHDTTSGPNNAMINRITSSWDEHLVTWTNQPGTDTVHQASLPASTSINQDYLNIDVTNMVQDFINRVLQNNGMMLQLANENPDRSLVFATSDHPNASLHPKLEVTYSPLLSQCLSYQYSNCQGVDAVIGASYGPRLDTTNFGSSIEFTAFSGMYEFAPTLLRPIIYWDLSQIPVNAIVTNAEISLFWNPNSMFAGHSVVSGSNECLLRKITSVWSEHTVTWNNFLTTDTTTQILVPGTITNQDDITINVTNIVQQFVMNPSTNLGFMMQLKLEGYNRSMTFCSSDHPDPAKHPLINICYYIPASTTSIHNIQTENNIRIINHYDTKSVQLIFNSPSDKTVAIELFDAVGRRVRMFKNEKRDEFSFSTVSLAGGIYILNISSPETKYSRKIFVE